MSLITTRSRGIVRSARGAHGGYELARGAGEISLLQVVEVLEGRTSLLECTAAPASCPRPRSGECRTLPV